MAKVYVGGEVDKKTADAMRALAKANERSFSAELRLALRAWLAKH